MKPDDYKPEAVQTGSGDALDRLLDGALAQYSQVEPRAGLEERVLANLRSQPAHRPWWMWVAIPAAVAAVVLVAISIRQSNRPTPSSAIQVQSTIRTAPVGVTPNPATTAKVQPSPVTRPRQYRTVATTAKPPARVQSQPEPRLATFPAPSPLTPEERLLLQMIDHHRDELATVAQNQQADQERFQKLLETESGEVPPQGSSNQQ